LGFRFQKHIGIVPGLRLNISKSGVSASIGERGAHLTIGRVPRITLGLPGSGLSYTETLPHGRRSRGGAGGLVPFVVRGLALMLGAAIGLAILAMIASSGG
jgi:Protein of unknown function (DUF4236)